MEVQLKFNKFYLISVESLVEASEQKEKVFIEYRGVEEEIEGANEYKKENWEFTLKVLTKCAGSEKFSFFKLISN